VEVAAVVLLLPGVEFDDEPLAEAFLDNVIRGSFDG
jgi:hypothetical protein